MHSTFPAMIINDPTVAQTSLEGTQPLPWLLEYITVVRLCSLSKCKKNTLLRDGDASAQDLPTAISITAGAAASPPDLRFPGRSNSFHISKITAK